MTTSLIKEQNNLEFKADFFPMTVVKLATHDLSAIKNQLSATIVTAPNYFKHAPIVIDIHTMNTADKSIDLAAICQLLREHNMIPVGIRGLDETNEDLALSAGLAIMKAPKSAEKKPEPSLTSGNRNNEPKPKETSINTKFVSTPIRAGTQVYAREGDLIVTAPVNAGGECFADGSIHIYGPLRGKALAGAKGNEKARIFCESLEADLIAIAGHYLTNEQIKIPKTKKPMIQIYLKDGTIHIEGI